MSQMNAGIILQGQTPDIMGNFSSGMAVRSQQNALAQQENLSNLYRTQGAQILAGDQQALNALAGIDPNAALGVQQGRLGMDQTRLGMDATRHGMKMDEANLGMRQQELAITKENARMRGLEFAAQMDAQTAAQTAAELERAIAMGTQAQTPEQWDAVMAQLGEDGQQYVGQFENRDMIIAGALGLKEALAMGAPADPTKGAPSGFMFTDPNNPAAGVTPLPGYKPTPLVQVGGDGTPQPEIGTVPQGFQAIWDAQAGTYRMQPIPGGPEDTSKSEMAAAEGSLQQSNIALDKIAQARELIDNSSFFNPATGFGAETAAGIGGTNAANYKAVTDTIEANIAFDALAQMRAASPTGGALGAISERELTLLGATLASLSQAQSPAQAKQHLAELELIYTQIMQKASAYPNASQFGFGGGSAPAPAESKPKRLKYNPETGELE
jgi:hypothetical protein